ncbi:MAG: hypothetical protein GXP51_08945 [Deltaproteobacteria bacterium]|nr:hypothetical protein [Deltaproteobacteria bacterium]
MRLDLNKSEEQVLADSLELTLKQLQDEIAHTDAFDYRELLKKRKEKKSCRTCAASCIDAAPVGF